RPSADFLAPETATFAKPCAQLVFGIGIGGYGQRLPRKPVAQGHARISFRVRFRHRMLRVARKGVGVRRPAHAAPVALAMASDRMLNSRCSVPGSGKCAMTRMPPR